MISHYHAESNLHTAQHRFRDSHSYIPPSPDDLYSTIYHLCEHHESLDSLPAAQHLHNHCQSNNHDALFDSSPDFAESATDYDHIDGFFYASAAEHHSRRNDQSGSIHHDVRFKLFDNVLPNSNWPNPDHDPTSLNILYDHHKQPRSYHSDALFDFASRDLHILSYKHASSNHSNDISSIHRTSKSHSPASNPIRNDTHHIHPSGLQLYDSPDDFRNTSLDIRNYLASLDSSFDGRPDHLPSRKHDDGSRANDNSSWAYRDLGHFLDVSDHIYHHVTSQFYHVHELQHKYSTSIDHY